MKVTHGAVAAALALTGVAVASPAQAAAPKPGVVVDYAYHAVKVKPATFYPYKDLYFSSVKWTSLGRTTGYATAVQNVNTCKPSCADANYKRTKVKLKFTTVKLSDCRKVFSKVKVTEIKSKKVRTFALPVFKKSC
ncbi:hypothetical protein [Symbioplanes lichenis]|uniref:hypothetical protein n=1 Tax=Symbioplanes lichenis TaxID=1629072 RepID=UPI00273A58EA|nr:hypothetical protein [Actinoplanes lichenis]